MKNSKLVIAWDIDDTILFPSIATGLDIDTPNYENIAIYRWFQKQGYYMVVWSGGGMDYARMWADKLGLNPDAILPKVKNNSVDLCFDDCSVDLAKVNVKVKRLNNSINRKEWNKHSKILIKDLSNKTLSRNRLKNKEEILKYSNRVGDIIKTEEDFYLCDFSRPEYYDEENINSVQFWLYKNDVSHDISSGNSDKFKKERYEN